MYTRFLSLGLFIAATVGMVALSDPAGAADTAAKKAAVRKKAVAKKKVGPLDTTAIFKKLDANSDNKLDLDEFKKLFSVQPEPKGKKGKEVGPFDLVFTFKSLDANGDKTLSVDEFKGIVPAIFPAPKK